MSEKLLNFNGYTMEFSGYPSSIDRKKAVMKTFITMKDRWPGASFHAVAKATGLKHKLSANSVYRIAREAGFETWKTL